jgi:TonB family protein
MPTSTDDAPYSELAVDTRAVALTPIDPPYPLQAQIDGVSGEVSMELIVSATGLVETVTLEKGRRADLDAAAITAIRRVRFSPAVRTGHPVRVRMAWKTKFQLH